jgi:acetyl esterase/lipase
MAATQGDDGNADASDPIDRVSSRTQAVVAWFPPTDMVNWNGPNGFALLALARPDLFERMFGDIKDLKSKLKGISPIHFVNKDSPPLLLVHGDADKTVPLQQSEIMRDKYAELGLPIKLVVQPGGGHSSWPGIMDQYPIVWDWFQTYLR